MFSKIKKERVPHLIVEQIRRKIITGKLKAGEYLPTELELAQEFEVGRSSVREALQLLEGFGVIERRRRKGTIIRNVTIEDLAEVYVPKPEQETLMEVLEAREALENIIIKLAVERASNEEIIELEKTLDWMFENPESSAENDVVFHIMLAKLSQNEVMVNIVKSLKKTMEKNMNTNYDRDQAMKIINEHREIVKAIKERNVELALECMKKHWETSKENLKISFEE